MLWPMDPFKPWEPKSRLSAPPILTVEDAQTVALKAVAFVAGDDVLLPRFVALTGCGLDEIRQGVTHAAFLGGVLDFILGDEPTLMAFVEAAEIAPETPAAARAKLP